MRILVPVLGFAAAGGYRVLSELATHWTAAGNEVTFLTPQGEALPYFPTAAKLLAVDENGRLAEPGAYKPNVPLRGLRKLLALYLGISKIGADFDIILANHSLTPWAIIAARPDRSKLFYYIQAYEPQYYYLEKQPVKWLLARGSYFLPFSQITNADVYSQHHGVRPQAVVPAGIDLNTYTPKATPRDFSDGADIVLGCIGRREPAKGTEYVIAAFEKLAASDQRYRLRVAYNNLPKAWSHPRCEIVTPKNDTELAAYYRSIDIMITAGTVQHGAPHYPVMEAMASATPVINTGYMPATDTNSWIVSNRDPNSIFCAVKAITSDPNYYDRVEQALNRIKDFSWPRVATDMLEVFKNRQIVKSR